VIFFSSASTSSRLAPVSGWSSAFELMAGPTICTTAPMAFPAWVTGKKLA
jgi:hypothetical protein